MKSLLVAMFVALCFDFCVLEWCYQSNTYFSLSLSLSLSEKIKQEIERIREKKREITKLEEFLQNDSEFSIQVQLSHSYFDIKFFVQFPTDVAGL